MSGDADTVREALGVPTAHHRLCNSLVKYPEPCDCYMRLYAPTLRALARLEACAAQRDALAEALREIADATYYQSSPGWATTLTVDVLGIARAALAEAATREATR